MFLDEGRVVRKIGYCCESLVVVLRGNPGGRINLGDCCKEIAKKLHRVDQGLLMSSKDFSP